MQTVDPNTGQVLKEYVDHTMAEVEAMVVKAEYAFERWHQLSFDERAMCMRRAAGILRQNKDNYARMIAQEMGKPLPQGKAEIEKCAATCDFYAEHAAAFLAPKSVKTDASNSYIAYEPLGVILAVMPWNFPFWQVFRCAAPTLMAGNALILKHASNVSGCALAIEDVFKRAAFPDGLFRTALVPSSQVKAIIEHPLVRAVTLTGSTGAGKSIAAAAGGAIKKSVLELGGSDPYIVLADADLEQAAIICASSRMINGGQSCVAAKRFIIHTSVYARFEELFTARMRDVRMGSPLDERMTLGPMARHDLRDQIHAQVQKSVALGARLVLGGEVPPGPGAFYPPTILADTKPGMPAHDEELFGPVAVLYKAGSEEQAIKIANDSVFGLGAAIFTKDLKKGERIAVHQMQAGCCFVNEAVKSDPYLPFGGIKLSGYGRELSEVGIKEFVNIKTVYIK